MPSIDFLKHLIRKLKTGNLRSIHLNALPGRYATRLDVSKFKIINKELANDFLEKLLTKREFKLPISFDKINLNNRSEDDKIALNFIAKKLNSLSYQNEDNFFEHGIKTFGFGYPILLKRDKKNPQKIIKAPLVIWHLDIEKSKRKANEWKIIKKEDFPISLNEVLISHINQDEGITICKLACKYLEDGIIDSEEIVQISKEILNQLNALEGNEDFSAKIKLCPNRELIENDTNNIPWISWSGIFGLFRTQKESIIADFDKLIENHDSFEFENLKVETYQTSTISSVDTDPSQEEILNSISKNNLRVIQGPPGTGKSQALSAIITNALESGAKCLVVCEKKTALDVIHANLGKLGLDKLCAVVDDVSRDRKKIIQRVRAIMDEVESHPNSFHSSPYNSNLKEFNCEREKINSKHRAVLKKVLGDDRWKDIIGKYIGTLKVEGEEVLKALKKELYTCHFQYNFEEFDKLKKVVKNGANLFKEINSTNHPLETLNDDIFVGPYYNSTRIEMEDNLEEIHIRCKKYLSQFKNNIECYGKRFSDNGWFNKNLTIFLSIFSRKFNKLKNEKYLFQENYKKLFRNHMARNYFSFSFSKSDSIKDLKVIYSNLTLYEETIRKLINHFYAFQKFFEWKSFFLSLNKEHRDILVTFINLGVKDWKSVFENWYFDGVLRKFEHELGPFHQNSSLINKLSELNQALKKKQPNKIIDLWARKQQSSINKYKRRKRNIKTLYNYRKNKFGNKNPLRKIIQTDFNLFTNFFPVVMVNPVVASSILPLKEGLFDVVIFDEASQLRLEDNYPSFLRGKYRIISGDAHQMPPSNYFGKEIALDPNVNEEDEEDENKEMHEEDLEMAGKESLLEYAADLGIEKSYLDFHYRSRHPFLIDFSNAAFYGKRLTPMPEKYSYKPIRFVEVDGIYEKNRTNPAEANEVIKILLEDIPFKKNGEYLSVGIATFNMEQRNLIHEMILEKCYEDENARKIFEKLRESGLFVKNLENIQGDERDIIIISTTFGYNSERKFRQNFGPINQQKGYKLLNVIITRAKHRLYLCSSIPDKYIENFREEVEIRGNIGKGIFYAYLAYAKSIEKGDNVARQNILKLLKGRCEDNKPTSLLNLVESPFEQEVYDYLTEHIEKERIEMQYPVGGFRIDFVIKSKITNKPIIALECDGAKYHSSEEAYSHDMYRQKLIEEKMEFEFFRIWSTNWWNDPYGETQRLVRFIKSVEKKEEERMKNRQKEPVNKREIFSDEPFSKARKKIFAPDIDQTNKPEKSKNEADLNYKGSHLQTKEPVLIKSPKPRSQSDLSYQEKQTVKTQSNKSVKYHLRTSNNLFEQREFLIFTTAFNVYKLKNAGINSKQEILKNIKMKAKEKPIYITGTFNYSGYLLFGFENGKMAKIFLKSYQTQTNRAKLKNAYNNESKLIFIEHIEKDINLIAVSSIDKILLFNTNQINPKESTKSKGVQIMKPKNNSKVKSFKGIGQVKFKDLEYYRKNIPATGNYILREDYC